MKKLHKLAATVAMALSLGVTHQAYASQALGPFPDRGGMVVENGGRGDALLFPVFYGYGENYFTISNSSGEWVQGHLRFRGAAWSGELLDFDVILSPGDVFVFRLADIDGDGYWEIDESLDIKNFQYTGMNLDCSPEVGTVGVAKTNCLDQQTLLIPQPTNLDVNDATGNWKGGNITPELIEHHRHVGYVEFIGEGVFYPRTLMSSLMPKFIDPANAGKLSADGQRRTGNKLGTSLWSWVGGYDAYPAKDSVAPVIASSFKNLGLNPFYTETLSCDNPAVDTIGLADRCDRRTARGVPNVLSGTAFITQAGQSHGVAYNAESLFDFRTNRASAGGDRGCTGTTVAVGTDCGGRSVRHRVDNYPTDNAVILHHENPRASSTYSYVYAYAPVPAEDLFESRISFNNTWGPTLADGNDYTLVQSDGGYVTLTFPGNPYRWVDSTYVLDTWDYEFGDSANSIAEVEEAVRKGYPSSTPYPTFTPADKFGASARQRFTSYYSDNAVFDKSCEGNQRVGSPPTCGAGSLSSWYFAFFPTKFFYGEHPAYWTIAATKSADNVPGINLLGVPNGTTDDKKLLDKHGYLEAAVTNLLNWAKPLNVEVWDIFENTPMPRESECLYSPCVVPGAPSKLFAVREELAYFSIKNLKNLFEGTAHQSWDAGRVVLSVPSESNMCTSQDPRAPTKNVAGRCIDTFPGLLYTFDVDNVTGYLAHWRPMER
jgi:hypothetical protein